MNRSQWSIDTQSLQSLLVPQLLIKTLLLVKVIKNITSDWKTFLQTAIYLEHLLNSENVDLLQLLWEYKDLLFLPSDSPEKFVIEAEFRINTCPAALAHTKLLTSTSSKRNVRFKSTYNRESYVPKEPKCWWNPKVIYCWPQAIEWTGHTTGWSI